MVAFTQNVMHYFLLNPKVFAVVVVFGSSFVTWNVGFFLPKP